MGSVGMQFPNALWAYLRRSRSVLRRETINFDVRYPVDRLDQGVSIALSSKITMPKKFLNKSETFT